MGVEIDKDLDHRHHHKEGSRRKAGGKPHQQERREHVLSLRQERGKFRQSKLGGPSGRSILKPSILVCPDFQNTAEIEKRARRAIAE